MVLSDIYNFDEVGFATGEISSDMVTTSAERRSDIKPAQPRNLQWVMFIQGVNFEVWAIPPLSSSQANITSLPGIKIAPSTTVGSFQDQKLMEIRN